MSFLRVAFFQQWRVFNGCNEHPRGSPGSQSAMPLSCQAMWPRWRACSKVLTCWLCPACRAPPWRLMFARCGWVRRTSLCARGTQSHHGWNLTDLPAISLPACQPASLPGEGDAGGVANDGGFSPEMVVCCRKWPGTNRRNVVSLNCGSYFAPTED